MSKEQELGFVTSTRRDTVFCRYWSHYAEPLDLRTKANSEGVDRRFIHVKDTVPQERVTWAILKYVKNDPSVGWLV